MTLLASLLASLEARPLLILSLLSFLDLFAVASVTSAIGAPDLHHLMTLMWLDRSWRTTATRAAA